MLGEVVARKLNAAVGPTAIVIPLRGSVEWDRPSEPLYNPEGLVPFSSALKRLIKPEVKVVELDAHINDKEFADAVLSLFDAMVFGQGEEQKRPVASPAKDAVGQ